jgi:transcriptional regulator with XRE-family HTH domain
MTQEHASINGALLRLRREARGWVQSDVATRACMSVKQIRQLEDGGLSAFYSDAVKVTAAKKVGALLGLTPEEVFSHGQPEVATAASSISPEADLAALLASTHESAHDEPYEHALSEQDAVHQPEDPTNAHDSADSHHDASAHVADETHLSEAATQPAAPVLRTQDVSESTLASSASTTTSQTVQPAKAKFSLLWLVVLFIGAIVLAAVFKPEQEVVPTEPPPPLQPALQSEPGAEAGKEGATAPEGAAPGAAGTAPAAAGGGANAVPNVPANAAVPGPGNAPVGNGAAPSTAPAAATPSPAASAATTPAAAPKTN